MQPPRRSFSLPMILVAVNLAACGGSAGVFLHHLLDQGDYARAGLVGLLVVFLGAVVVWTEWRARARADHSAVLTFQLATVMGCAAACSLALLMVGGFA
jgi:hypothetical protein